MKPTIPRCPVCNVAEGPCISVSALSYGEPAVGWSHVGPDVGRDDSSTAGERDVSAPANRDTCDDDTSARAHDDTSQPGRYDASQPGRYDASPSAVDDKCAWCGKTMDRARFGPRRRTCCKSHRQALSRFGRHLVATERADRPLRIRYADPPYPGLSRRYYGDHPDFAGEVDHEALLSRLQDADGWALSTSADALPELAALCRARGIDASIAAWVRGSRRVRASSPLSTWEPVIYRCARTVVLDDQVDDALVYYAHPRLTEPRRVIGAKPAAFAAWLFRLVGARPGDQFVDEFPGSGGMSRAWSIFESKS